MQRETTIAVVVAGFAVAACPGNQGTMTTDSSDPTGGTAGETTGPSETTASVGSTTAEPPTGTTATTAVSATDDPATTTTTTGEPGTTTHLTTGDSTTTTTGNPGTTTGGPVDCSDEPPIPAGPDVVLAPEFAEFYKTYELGQVPGIPTDSRLGGCVISNEDPNLLLVAGDSETATGKVWAIEVVRGNCDHIVNFKGVAQLVADTPYVDANLALVESGLMFYTAWPINQIGQLLPGQMAPAVTTDMAALGVENSVSGLGFVPPGFVDAGGMRTITWPGGKWYHLDRTANGDTFTLANAQQTAALPFGPGGFAYVPKGSPGFEVDHLIVSEWSAGTVGVYRVDDQGDPLPESRKDFYLDFPSPWGAYFEPLTGDFMFLTWGAGQDRIYIVQGFEPPPPIPQ
ncbi:hypothetical protein SAMN02745121_05894 [Nannocystis exedens]|uniref:Uncharacterized protein n=1 Tax=Nannocystis exedens TaxID=54 RepID=A0A1I2E3I3_9BACT|nr:hypothetical protein [Nannocystis exedens]PCC69250.1 hypothetical protein NAEX_02272 [Nannocystis exedens]SFE87213.1 hypothetical protein SAMN02745121_05894 [Nannocystis exedens]